MTGHSSRSSAPAPAPAPVAGGAASGAYKVNSLTGLDAASAVEGEVVWDPPRSLWNGFMLAGALVLGPLTFGWSAFAIFLATSAVTLCAGHSVGFHRRLIHRSFECPRWLDWLMMWLRAAGGTGRPGGGGSVPRPRRAGR